MHPGRAQVRAGALQGYDSLTRELGANPRKLLQRHGIDPRSLSSPESLISLGATADLLEDTAAETGCPDFGLRLGARQTPEMLGPLAVALQNARTAEEAIGDATRYLFVHSPAYEAVLDDPSPIDPACAVLRLGVRMPDQKPRRQLIEGIVASAWQLSRAITAGQLKLVAVWMPHTPSADEVIYRQLFECRVDFSQPFPGLHARREQLRVDLAGSSPILREMALEFMAQRAPADTGTTANRVRRALSSTIGANRGTKGEIASLLLMHPRTLQRALASEGVTFESLRTEVYREAMLTYLRDTDIPLAEVARALGYADQSVLTRTCARWFGTTPARIRKSGKRPTSEGDQITIAPDPEAPTLTLADVERPGPRLTDEEIEAEFADIPVDRND